MNLLSLLLFADLTHSVVNGPATKAVTMLLEEVQKRSNVQWTHGDTGAKIAITQTNRGPAEGYSIRVTQGVVHVDGNDARGVMFGVGRLLRAMHMTEGRVTLEDNFNVTTAPKFPLRGHQLGYRPKTNSYDGWSLPVWEQYIRDLVVFGANAVELIPPRSDDAPTSPHFPLPPMEMMVGMSKLLDDYGLDVWIWYPAMDPDYTKPEQVKFAIDEWAEVFKKLPRVDAVFVPGGDPGHTEPRVLMALLAEQAKSLHKYHPRAQMWVSPQGFSDDWMKQFIGILQNEQPDWLAGVVYGPQVRGSIQELRAAVPRKYALRHYPDITHSKQSQYPVPDWDWAFAFTEAREVINPRPMGMAGIFRATQPDTLGFITYSEGCNDDVNKTVWSALGWDPTANIASVISEYSRYFIGEKSSTEYTQGIFDLERNWQGKLAENAGVEATLARFQKLERQASPRDLANWRVQQLLYRAYYDAYTRRRQIYESNPANWDKPFEDPLRARVFELGEALFKSIKMQLSVKLYQAISVDRGANLDTIDFPLHTKVPPLDPNPGPGGFYDDLGIIDRQPHLVRDPLTYIGFAYNKDWPLAWWTHAGTWYDSPLRMRYTGLDAKAKYKLRVVYAGDSPRVRMRLMAGSVEVHPYMDKPSPMRALEFDIPASGIVNGELLLSWTAEPGRGGNGRGCEVAEVWLLKQ